MPWKLRENVHWCDCAGRAVFLDLKADLYFCLPRESNAAFLRLTKNQSRPRDPELLEPLVRRAVLVEDAARTRIQPPVAVEAPQSDFPAGPSDRIALFNLVRAICSELWTGRLLRRRPLHEVIESGRAIEPRSAPRDEYKSIQALVTASSASAFFLRSHDRCLVRGLALHAACRRRGVAAKLVLGVVAHPFTAHCWVQLGTAVLVGGFEQARLYTPILVVE
jgi:hypothetical protein